MIKLKQLIQNLINIEKIYGDVAIIYSCDDEGNAFNPVHYTPSIGIYEDCEFRSESEDIDLERVNAVCIN